MSKVAACIFLLCLLGQSELLNAQQTGFIQGKVLDSLSLPIPNASVVSGTNGVLTDSTGFYNLEIPSGKRVEVRFSHLGFKSITRVFEVRPNRRIYFSPRLETEVRAIDEVIVRDQSAEEEGIVRVDAELAQVLPSASPGIESVLKTLPGVSFNNELSTQYNVRGGSFEENLVYVNEVEVYRPFLIRNAQQEGLSFVNPDMSQKVNFSAGGFQAKYGDKMSSVLDITYRKPQKFGAKVEASFLGASGLVEGSSSDGRLKALLGMRYRNNSLLLNSSDVDADFKPEFIDFQGFLSYEVSDRLDLDLFASYARNKYEVDPSSRRANFGPISQPISVSVNYQGKEDDRYETVLAALTARYEFNENLSGRLTFSSYQTAEQEYYDILAFYTLGEVNADFGSDDLGNAENQQFFGAQLDHARNNLRARINSLKANLTYVKGANLIEVGLKAQSEDIKDRINEWQVVDSAGFSVRPPNFSPGNDEPYTPFEGPILPFYSINADNEVRTTRFMGFAQWSRKSTWRGHKIAMNLGLRGHFWSVDAKGQEKEDQLIWSPRAQFSIKPDWDKDMLFRLSGGLYQQPPFYRELRDSTGTVKPEVQAQQAIHVVLGHEYSFQMWKRPFRLTSEVYYKDLNKVNPFTIDNVRIRYRANNDAVAYAYGAEVRLQGEFVPGTLSWLSLGYLKTEENINDRGYISRPTDQRFKVALLYQDYMPSLPSLRMYLNLVYNTGVPGGSPSYADPYEYQSRLPAYFRTDLGVNYFIFDPLHPKADRKQQWIKEMSVGLILFNMFDNQNSITNSWVRDVSSDRYIGIPNYLTGRVLNLRFAASF